MGQFHGTYGVEAEFCVPQILLKLGILLISYICILTKACKNLRNYI